MANNTMYYREATTANTIDEVLLNASTLDELFSESKKLKVFDDIPYVTIGKTALNKMNSDGFLTKTAFSTYAFGTLGFTNAITATAIIAASAYGWNAVYVGSKITIHIESVARMPQGRYYHCVASAYTVRGYKHFNFCLTASYKDYTAENKWADAHPQWHNTQRGFIPLEKTEDGLPMRFCDNVYIGNFDAFSFSLE